MTSPWTPAFVVAASALVVVAVVADLGGDTRVLLAVGYLIACPGLAITPLLPLEERFSPVLVVAVSFVLDALLATLLLASGGLGLAGFVSGMVTVCLFGSALQVARLMERRGNTDVQVYPR